VQSKIVNGTLWKLMLDWAKSGAIMVVIFRSKAQLCVHHVSALLLRFFKLFVCAHAIVRVDLWHLQHKTELTSGRLF
jgi:hypothetical protein